MNTVKDVINYINKNNVKTILIDYFDTIVSRSVYPEYTKKLTSKKIVEYFGLRISAEDLYKYRMDLEFGLCQSSANTGKDLEFDLRVLNKDLYKYLYDLGLLSKDVSESTFINKSLDFEMKIETDVQILQKDTLDLLKIAKAKGIKLIVVSDFYFPKDLFMRMLDEHKLSKFFSNVYVSSSYNIKKSSMRLYDIVLKEEKIDKKTTIMLGDNEWSDVEAPNKKGIKSFLIERKHIRDNYESLKKKLDFQTSSRELVVDKLNELIHKYSVDTLFPEIVLIYYKFIANLYEQLSFRGVNNVFFLSREGELLKELFDIYQYNKFVDRKIKTNYLKVSRKSTFIASLKPLKEESFETIFRSYKLLSIKNFLKSLNLSDANIEEIVTNIDADCLKEVDGFSHSKEFRILLNNKIFKKTYEEVRISQKQLFIKYLEQSGVECNSKKGLYIVDAGWKGTMQDHFAKIVDCDVVGFYIGIMDPTNVSIRSQKEGLIFSNKPFFSKNYEHLNRFSLQTTLYEMTLGASHGSAESYYESNGRINVKLSARKKEKQFYEDVIRPMQSKYIEMFKVIIQIFELTHFNLEEYSDLIVYKYMRIILLPTIKELEFFRQGTHYENFGVFYYASFHKEGGKRATLNFWKQIIRHPIRFIKQSWWIALDLYNHKLFFLSKIYGRWRLFKLKTKLINEQ